MRCTKRWIDSIETNIIGLQRGKKMPNKFYEQLQDQSEGDWVKVVRCKDCFLCETRQTANYLPFLYCKFHDCSVLGDFYCFWGIRREDAKTD